MFHRLEREGFYFGVDTHLRVQTLLRREAYRLRQNPEKLKYLLAPLLAHSAEGQAKFYRVFDEFLEFKQAEVVRLFQEGEGITDTQEEQLKVVRRNTYPKWLVPSVVGLFVLLSLLVLANRGEDAHPIPNARFHVLDGDGDTLSDNIFRPEVDTISVSGYIQDSLSFHFDPGQDTAGITEAELIWIYGDGNRDTLQFEDGFSLPRFKVYPLKGEYLVELIVKHPHHNLDTKLEEEMDFFHANLSLEAECKDSLKASIYYEADEINIGDAIRFNAGLNATISEDVFDYLWKFGLNNSSTEPHPLYTFEKQGEYKISVTLTRKRPLGIPCQDIVYKEIFVEVGSDQPSIQLTKEFPLIKDESGVIQHRLTRLSIGLLSLLLTVILLTIGLLIRYITYKPVSRELEEEFEPGEEGPFSIKLPRQDYLIAADKGIYDLASVMRQRRMGNLQQLNIPTSIGATIKEAGLPILHFETNSSATEYLLLIEQHHPQSHLARFFGRITEILRGEDVLLESFYYDGDPRICWNDSYTDGISLEQLQQRYGKHRLILFTTGHQLVDVYEPKLKSWFIPVFEAWKENRLILTPTPVVDWGYKERLLMEHIDVLPLDIPGQMHMIQMFDDVGQPDFYEHKKSLLEQFPAASHSVKKYDLQTVEGLRAYLGSHLFNWLAATAIYPLPNWEVTLAIGHELSQIRGGAEKEFLLTFENLLTIARIPWMQSCDLSQELRLDLLDSLDPNTERIARQAILELLGEVRVKSNSHAEHKIAIQKITNQFFLTPGDQEIAKKMHYLTQQDKLGDSVTKKRLNQEVEIMDGQKGSVYLHNLFGFLRPREYLLGGGIGFAFICLISYFLYQYVGKEPRTIDWLSPNEVKESIWVHHHLQQDSAMVWHNQAIDLASTGDLESADLLMARAVTTRSYPLADTNYSKIVYSLGKNAFNDRDYRRALSEFGRVDMTIEHDVSQHTWAGAILSYYHLGQIEQVKYEADTLNFKYPGFLLEHYPKLYAALDLEHNYQYHIDLAASNFNNKYFMDSRVHADSALMVREGDSIAMYWFNRADSALDAQQYIAEEPLEKDNVIESSKPVQLGRFEGHISEIVSIDMYQNNRILTGSRDYTARLWDGNGRLIQTFKHESTVSSVAISPNGQYLATGSYDRTVKIWNAKSGAYINEISVREQVHSIAFSPDGRYILVGKDYGAIMYDFKGSQVKLFETATRIVSVAFSKDGKYVLTGNRDGQVELWDRQKRYSQNSFRVSNHSSYTNAKLLKSFKLDFKGIKEQFEPTAVAFSPDSKKIAAIGGGKSISIWDINSENKLYNYSSTLSGEPSALKFSDDGRYLLVARLAVGAEIWDLDVGRSISSVSRRSLTAATMDANATQLVLAANTIINVQPILKARPDDFKQEQQSMAEPIQEKPEIDNDCSEILLEKEIYDIATNLKNLKLPFSKENNTDVTGIFYRVFDKVKDKCDNVLIPSIRSRPNYSNSSNLATFYFNNGAFREVTNPESTANEIKPGTILFYGKKATNSYQTTKKSKIPLPKPFDRINHMGIVISVDRNKEGDVMGYYLFHALNANSQASFSTHSITDNPPFGNGKDDWVGIAFPIQ